MKYAILFLLNTIVFGYGLYLADEKFNSFMCVLTWALFNVFIIGSKELDEN